MTQFDKDYAQLVHKYGNNYILLPFFSYCDIKREEGRELEEIGQLDELEQRIEQFMLAAEIPRYLLQRNVAEQNADWLGDETINQAARESCYHLLTLCNLSEILRASEARWVTFERERLRYISNFIYLLFSSKGFLVNCSTYEAMHQTNIDI